MSSGRASSVTTPPPDWTSPPTTEGVTMNFEMVECPQCHGSGLAPNQKDACGNCGGLGQVPGRR
jgi:RecJ-like exonuclease